jgi:ribosomal protein L21E
MLCSVVFKLIKDHEQQQQQQLKFKVELQQDFVEYKKGDMVEVELQLPSRAGKSSMVLKGSSGSTTYDVTLCINAQ